MRQRTLVMCCFMLFGAGIGWSASPDVGTGDSTAATIPVMVELADEPTAVVYSRALGGAPQGAPSKALAAATEAAQGQLATVQAAQQSLVSRLEAEYGARVLSRTQRVYNGVAVLVGRDDLAQIAAMPGVRAVFPLPRPIAANAQSVPFIGTVEAWTHDPPATGAGVSIGIIDSGIDYIHRDLGGSGSDADYAANDPETIDDGFFPNDRVVGGWDFAGDVCGQGAPVEDPDPFETGRADLAHGTHVAGIAGGSGVDGDGEPFDGPYDETTPFSELTIGPGVAPEASLYALKVLGRCSPTSSTDEGVTGAITAAIEWAADPNGDGDFADHLDVINLSQLCSPYGASFELSCAEAADNAALVGVAVAAGAGNNSNSFYNELSPSTAIRALSVGESWGKTRFGAGATVNTPDAIAGSFEAAYQSFGTITPVTADVAVAEPRDACAPLVNAGEIDGHIALVDWWGCGLDVKAASAEAAGAVGVVVTPEGWPEPPLQMPGGSPVGIPVAMIGDADGRRIRDLLPGVTMTIGFSPAEIDMRDVVAADSSCGPRAPDSLLKPDVLAPGMGIRSADPGSGTGAFLGSGTSMASPHGAGALAVLRELHPDWSVEELKALLMNTAADSWSGPDRSGAGAALSRAGAGRIDLGRAVDTQAVAHVTEPEGQVSVSFGLVDVRGRDRRSRTVRVVNKSTEAMTFDVDLVHGSADVPGVELSLVDDAPLTVAASSAGTFEVELEADPAAMRNVCDQAAAGAVPVKSQLPGVALPGGPVAMVRPCPLEETGTLILTPQAPHENHPVLRLPVHAVVRPLAAMEASVDRVFITGEGARFEVPLAGDGLDSGPTPPGIRSLVSAFELSEVSPDDLLTPVGQNFWDLALVGVSSDIRAREGAGQGLAEAVVSFAVVTHAPWAHPNQVGVKILIDRDRDGDFESTLENLPLLRWDSEPTDRHLKWSDVVWSVLTTPDGTAWQLPLNGLGAEVADTRLLNSDAMVLSARAADLGLSEGASVFDYRIDIVNRMFDLVVDSTEVHTFDAARPGLALTGEHFSPMFWDDLDGASIPVEYDREAYLANGSQGLLLIHHHNASGARAEVVDIVVGPADTGGAPVPVVFE